jgi:hypothetical protein
VPIAGRHSHAAAPDCQFGGGGTRGSLASAGVDRFRTPPRPSDPVTLAGRSSDIAAEAMEQPGLTALLECGQ